MPIATPDDLLRAAVQDLTTALESPKEGSLASHLPPTTSDALRQLTELLTNQSGTNQVDPLHTVIETEETPVRRVQILPGAIIKSRSSLRSHKRNFIRKKLFD